VKTESNSMNPTHMPKEVSPTVLSTSEHTRYKGWLCTGCSKKQ